MTRTHAVPHLVDALAKLAKRHRLDRKVIVAPTVSAGRELLGRLSLEGAGWVGFEIATPRPLALTLARAGMGRAGLSALDAFEEQALLDRALDAAIAHDPGPFGDLSEGVGFRRSVHEAVVALRLADIGPAELDKVRLADWGKRRFLMRVLQRYERLLAQRGRADSAVILTLGITAVEEAGGLPAELGAGVVAIVPGLGTRGLAGRFVAALCARGARVLETDPVLGLELPEGVLWNRSKVAGPGSSLFDPTEADGEIDAGIDAPRPGGLAIELFSAASIEDELREVLRRVARAGVAWDDVELVAADPVSYGSALHALATRLGVPVTYAVGLPIERTRTGRVVKAYLDWITEGFQAAPIRRLLEAGDLRPPRADDNLTPSALARRFRSLRIGWGRKRYRAQIRRALSDVEKLEAKRHEAEDRFARRKERVTGELVALRRILFPALKATPTVPDRMGVGGQPVSPAEIARGLQAFLKRVPKGVGPDRQARDDVNRILERVEATLRRRTDFGAAVAILRRHLDVRVRAERPGADDDDRGAPWSSEGGAIHLADFEHGGYSGRRVTFLLGLDADRVPGHGGQDAVLSDADRRVLGDDLPTSTELMQERVHRFAALVARLRGSMTLSYTAWNPSEARSCGPSPMMLQALRLARTDGSLTFEDLHDAIGPVVSSVPGGIAPALDGQDVWMTALRGDGVLRSGVDAVRAAFPHLDRGLSAHEQRTLGTAGPVHGVVSPRPDVLDPRRDRSLVVSASRLEALGSCPLRYLHGSVLRVFPPDDPELDPDRWLDPLTRGRMLHGVFEEALREAREGGAGLDEAAFETLALRCLSDWAERIRAEVPSPGEGATHRELTGLREDVKSFVRMVRQRGAPWIALELTFGLGDVDAIELSVGGGAIQVRGAVDRVDEDLGGARVIDYKTGSVPDFSEKTGAYRGGRRLQHAIYSRVAEAALGGVVALGEYHFPTRRGQNQRFAFDRVQLSALEGLLGEMLDGVAAGAFVPTDEPDDCRFCDYAEVCRARRDRGKVVSPLAEWSREHLNTGLDPAFLHLKRARTYED